MNYLPSIEIDNLLQRYPKEVREKLQYLRELILETAEEMQEESILEESIKWGEPSFKTKIGSTLRMDWKDKNPEYYALYFQCTSKLVDTFRMVYGDVFLFEGKRAILFQLNQSLPLLELKECIKATLRYHKVKNQEFLGMGRCLY